MFEAIPVNEFLKRTEIDTRKDLEHSWGTVERVVSLRDLTTITAVQIMHMEYLQKILGHTQLVGNKARVYDGCKIHLLTTSPRAVVIGQKFIERKKYVALLENFGSILDNFSVPSGLANLGGLVLLGKLKDGTKAIAQYVPPIVEMNGKAKWTLLDGVHRNFLIQRVGAVTPIIAIEGVKTPFPCSLHDWSVIQPVDIKPPPEERYFDLQPDLFRDLKYVGIDG